jgi:hypothetical protein
MNASDLIAYINRDHGTAYKIVGHYAAGESGVASQAIEEQLREVNPGHQGRTHGTNTVLLS